jgi:GDP-L-fucose synthase
MKNIFIAGHNGMVGSAIHRALSAEKNVNFILKNRDQLDLLSQDAVSKFFKEHNVEEVYLAAAKVGGILANETYPADFIYENLQIQNNVIHYAHKNNVQKLLFLGSSCIYPKFANQPISETELLTSELEATNEAYAIAKIAGLKLCESYNRQYGRDYRCIMPTNLYGPGDTYHRYQSHVIPAMLMKIHEAKESRAEHINLWGSGKPLREFLHVDDLARAAIFINNLTKIDFRKAAGSSRPCLNVGSGVEVSIQKLSKIVADTVGFKGQIKFDLEMPDGTPRKLLNSEKLKNLGWLPALNLTDGIASTYSDFLMKRTDEKR